ncbi:hypothetical protein J2125_004305 [Erwinia toletana]|uniref:Uncharacterized protein n=1 Tax=Winslowiella toletana TaxID=92490 RepID=A0ABS4PEQ2_9GAMM|nr:hypothetical protein [Winslowiella toletana]MBP2171113.1 hypothetical protein [Winslowiella toletana]
MYKTPRFYSFIDELATVLDLFHDQSRKRALSESRTFYQKQIYYQDFSARLQQRLEITDGEKNYLSGVLSRLENLLSVLANIPVYSTTAPAQASNSFFNLFTYVFFINLASEMANKNASPFVNYFHRMSGGDFTKPISVDALLLHARKIIKEEVVNVLENRKLASSLSVYLARLDKRSFPKVSSIIKLKEDFCREAVFLKEKSAECYASKIYTILLACRVIFHLRKGAGESPMKLSLYDLAIQNKASDFINNTVLHEKAGADLSAIEDDNDYIACREYFLRLIQQQDPVNYLKQHDTRALWGHDNQVFLSYCMREQLYSDINKGRLINGTAGNFTRIIELLSDRQSGEDGLYIAMFGIVLTLRQQESVNYNLLEPLVNYYIDCQNIRNIWYFEFKTPFENYIPSDLTVREVNLALAIRSYNRSVDEGKINAEYCNPLRPLEKILKSYFLAKKFTSKNLEVSPVQGVKETIYDSLKKINFHIMHYGLHKEISVHDNGCISVLESLAGEYINKFLKLNQSQKMDIMRDVSPDEYNLDVKRCK